MFGIKTSIHKITNSIISSLAIYLLNVVMHFFTLCYLKSIMIYYQFKLIVLNSGKNETHE